MNKRALLGLYTLVSIAVLLALFAVLSDFSTTLRGYRIGLRFPSASGLHSGALVYESGVIVGSVDKVAVLPDYTTEIIIVLHSDVDVPSNAGFLILQPLTGDPSLRIYPHVHRPGEALVPPLPHHVLPVAEQPYGQSALSLAEFLASSQEQFSRVNALLQQFQERAPALLEELNHTLKSTDALVVSANRSLALLSNDAHHSLGRFTDSSIGLTAQLSQSLAIASTEVLDVTARLDQSAKRGQPHLDHLFVELDTASKSLAASVDSLHAIAADPSIHENVVKSTRSLAETAATFAALLGDLRQVTGSATTQAELRDAVAHIDAASQKADSFMGKFGHSSVPGVDYPSTLETPVPFSSPAGLPNSTSAPFRHADASQNARLLRFSLRESELSPMHSSPQGTPLTSPLLGFDRGPQTDFSVTVLPDNASSYLLGVDDIGNTNTFSLADIHHDHSAYYGGGILYSRLGVLGGVKAGPVGVEAKLYDPRRGSVDLYGDVYPAANLSLFAGERDVTRTTRRPTYGFDLHF